MKGMIRVVNVRYEKCDFYVGRGRGSVLGNPYKVKPFGPYEGVKAVELYRSWLQERIADGDEQVCGALDRIDQAARKGPVSLGCWCAPEPCHAEVIAEVLGERLEAAATVRP